MPSRARFSPETPYNTLPILPPRVELDTKPILRALVGARAALAELKQAGELIPNQAILINTLPILEARASSEMASDIDLMIISDSLTYGEVFGALERVTRTVGRKVKPTVYTAVEFSKRARTENAFVTRVLEQPKLWVIGSEHDLPVAA